MYMYFGSLARDHHVMYYKYEILADFNSVVAYAFIYIYTIGRLIPCQNFWLYGTLLHVKYTCMYLASQYTEHPLL